jgi:hypothetical protein
MLIDKIRICLIIMSLDVQASAEGLSKQNHGALGVIEVDVGDARRYEFLAFLADQSVDSGLTLSVTGIVWQRVSPD